MNWCCRSNKSPIPTEPVISTALRHRESGSTLQCSRSPNRETLPIEKRVKAMKRAVKSYRSSCFFFVLFFFVIFFNIAFHSSASFRLWEKDFVVNASRFFSSQKKSKKIMMAKEVNKIVFSFCDSFVSRININHYCCYESCNQGRESSCSWIENKRFVSHRRTSCLPRGSTPLFEIRRSLGKN